jgi:prepilin-type processing-associated H-X9-DG protein
MASRTDGNRDHEASASASPPPLQFGLRTIFIVTAIAAVLAAVTSAVGMVGFALAMFAICTTLLLFKRELLWGTGCIGCALSFAILILALPGVGHESRPSRPSRHTLCSNLMRQLALALRDYENSHGRFPPACINDANCQPMQSWRVLIWPEIDQGDFYSRYNIDEAWNGRRNSKVTTFHNNAYQCPSDGAAGPYDTSYVAVIAPGSVWSVPGGAKLSDITDGPEDTVLLVEMKNSGIKWAEPRDLDLNNLPPGITKQNLLHSLSNHAGGFNAVFTDGHVEFIPDNIPWADFQAMLTIAGGEKVDRSQW